jgi:hypothetical protein
VDELGEQTVNLTCADKYCVCSAETVFEYFVDPKQRQWMSWESKLASTFRPPPDTPFFKILVCNDGGVAVFVCACNCVVLASTFRPLLILPPPRIWYVMWTCVLFHKTIWPLPLFPPLVHPQNPGARLQSVCVCVLKNVGEASLIVRCDSSKHSTKCSMK